MVYEQDRQSDLSGRAIQVVELDSSDIIADKFEGIENVLRIKSNTRDGFPETNLRAITKDGKYFFM
ncbi:MAG: DUF4138 domain-containing protein [Flavobacteriales bacterium AspAUS03]